MHVRIRSYSCRSWVPGGAPAVTAGVLTSVVDDFGAQDGSHLQHSDEGLVHRSEGEGRHTVPPGHLSDVHGTVTWKSTER